MNKNKQRFDELELELIEIAATQFSFTEYRKNVTCVDAEKLYEWKVKSKNLIRNVCGENSEHYKAFSVAENIGDYNNTYDIFRCVRAVFHAAKDDYLGGYCTSVRILIEAEVFASQLEQAKELLGAGYYAAAAIIAGVVLETHLRELCISNNIKTGTMNRMNDDLAKSGIYTAIIQKQITSFAAIRNSAAHGKENDEKEGFKKEQVITMIQGIKNVLAISLD
jgi:hypothetical protein